VDDSLYVKAQAQDVAVAEADAQVGLLADAEPGAVSINAAAATTLP